MVVMNLEKRTVCLHQVFRSEYYPRFVQTDGIGNCYECEHDPVNNKNCNGYVPVTLNCFEVNDYDSKV